MIGVASKPNRSGLIFSSLLLGIMVMDYIVRVKNNSCDTTSSVMFGYIFGFLSAMIMWFLILFWMAWSRIYILYWRKSCYKNARWIKAKL